MTRHRFFPVNLRNTLFLYEQHFYKQRQAEIGKKIKKKLSSTLRLNRCFLEIIRFFHPRYHPKVIGYILKSIQKNVRLLCGSFRRAAPF